MRPSGRVWNCRLDRSARVSPHFPLPARMKRTRARKPLSVVSSSSSSEAPIASTEAVASIERFVSTEPVCEHGAGL